MVLLLAVFCMLVLTARDVHLRAMIFCTVVGIGLSFVWVLYWITQPHRGVLRVASGRPLRFTPQKIILVYSIGAGLFLILAGAIVIYTWVSSSTVALVGPVGRRGGGVILIVGGLVFLANQVPRLFVAHGLTLDADGVMWTGGWGKKRVSWKDLESVTLGAERGARQLWLGEMSGSHHALYPMSFGSDPETVAEIIEYFRRHPSQRELLVDPITALRAVVEIRESRSPSPIIDARNP
ncbi:hypothetical protein [Mycetocola saprophilus]|uniref:hypothetical protein n=1 Tax=Mycetocola saprophilus TaxID=76636 RepID=UPI0012DED6FA|nr:hypothetical protein [Mycetocola saprophilus]